MKTHFFKYHALGNDFILIEPKSAKLSSKQRSSLTLSICDRTKGVGADGLLYLSKGKKGLTRIDVYNSDGGWAEKSGNGLRIVGLHTHLRNKRSKSFSFEMGGEVSQVKILKKTKNGFQIKTELGTAVFDTKKIPVKSKQQFMINTPLKIGEVKFPVTCLSVGNPHTVLFVDNFDFDWQDLGSVIENHTAFSKGTNVEFVKVVSKNKLKVAEWERGAGATGSSGTGAASAVSAAVMLGIANRKCKVEFEAGSLQVEIRKSDDVIELTGPVQFICEGRYEYK